MRETARGVRTGRFARRSSRGTSSSSGAVERRLKIKSDRCAVTPGHVCVWDDDAGVAGRGTRSGGCGDALEAQELVSLVPGQFTAAGDDPAARGGASATPGARSARARTRPRRPIARAKGHFSGTRSRGRGRRGRSARRRGSRRRRPWRREDRRRRESGIDSRPGGSGRAGPARRCDADRFWKCPLIYGLTERVSRQQQLFMFPPRWIRDQDFVGSRGDFDRGA